MLMGGRGRDVEVLDMFGGCMIKGLDFKCRLAWGDVYMGLNPFIHLLLDLEKGDWERREEAEAFRWDVLNYGTGVISRQWLAEVYVTESVLVCPGVITKKICFSWQVLLKQGWLRLRRYGEGDDGNRSIDTVDLFIRQASVDRCIEVDTELWAVELIQLLAKECVKLEKYAKCGGDIGSRIMSSNG